MAADADMVLPDRGLGGQEDPRLLGKEPPPRGGGLSRMAAGRALSFRKAWWPFPLSSDKGHSGGDQLVFLCAAP